MRTHEQIEQELDELFEESDWAEHDDYPLADWRYEVANDDTRQGYRSWLYNQLANEEEEEGEEELPATKQEHTADIWFCPNCLHTWLAFEGETESHCPECGTHVKEDTP